MLRVYAAWTVDAPEIDAVAIQDAMGYANIIRDRDPHGTSGLRNRLPVAGGPIEPSAGRSDKNDGGEGGITRPIRASPLRGQRCALLKIASGDFVEPYFLYVGANPTLWRPMRDLSMAERVGFEPTCRFYPTIRFRVGAVMTASVPLRPCPKSLDEPHYGDSAPCQRHAVGPRGRGMVF